MSQIVRFIVRVGVCAIPALVFHSVPALAAVPQQMNFQGILLDDDLGTVVDSSYLIRFTIYDDSTGGIVLWTEDQVLPTENGLFNTFFGLNNPIPGNVFDEVSRWLEIELVGIGAYEPRSPIGTVAYAYRVESVNGATGGDIYGDVTLHSTLTIGDLDGNAGALQLTDGSTITLLVDGTDGTFDLPANSVDASDIVNESGIAANHEAGPVELPQGNDMMTDLVTVTITIPSDGYIVVQGRCTFRAEESFWKNAVRVQIDDSPGGALDPVHFSEAGAYLDDDDDHGPGVNALTSSPSYNLTKVLYTDRVYYREAGTYTFRLEGMAHGNNSGGAVSSIRNSFVTATFHPTSYGAVETVVTQSEAPAFQSMTPVTVSADPSDGAVSTVYKVDLRELELRAAQLEAELERAKRELAEAQLRQR